MKDSPNLGCGARCLDDRLHGKVEDLTAGFLEVRSRNGFSMIHVKVLFDHVRELLELSLGSKGMLERKKASDSRGPRLSQRFCVWFPRQPNDKPSRPIPVVGFTKMLDDRPLLRRES